MFATYLAQPWLASYLAKIILVCKVPSITHNSLKYLGSLAYERLKGFFSNEIRDFKLWKMPK